MDRADFRNVEFGVCFEIDGNIHHYKVPVDETVKEVLVEMRNAFSDGYDGIDGDVQIFEASEKYGPTEKLRIDLNQDYLASINNLYHHQNIPVNNVNLSENLLFTEYYFAEFTHTNGSKTIGVKRPNQFKALLKQRMIKFANDAFHAVEDKIFKLDNDFDFLVHDTYIEILHPTGFIYITDLDEQIFNTIVATAQHISNSVRFVNFTAIGDFVIRKSSKRAAKLLASIKSRNDLANTDRQKLLSKCVALGLNITVDGDDRLNPADEHIIDFLEILDRRAYDYDITDIQEIYVAGSRKKKQLA